MFKVILYHPGQYGVFSDDTYHVCEDVYALQLFKALIPDILRREMILCG